MIRYLAPRFYNRYYSARNHAVCKIIIVVQILLARQCNIMVIRVLFMFSVINNTNCPPYPVFLATPVWEAEGFQRGTCMRMLCPEGEGLSPLPPPGSASVSIRQNLALSALLKALRYF